MCVHTRELILRIKLTYSQSHNSQVLSSQSAPRFVSDDKA